jgi:hypothetical protein
VLQASLVVDLFLASGLLASLLLLPLGLRFLVLLPERHLHLLTGLHSLHKNEQCNVNSVHSVCNRTFSLLSLHGDSVIAESGSNGVNDS